MLCFNLVHLTWFTFPTSIMKLSQPKLIIYITCTTNFLSRPKMQMFVCPHMYQLGGWIFCTENKNSQLYPS